MISQLRPFEPKPVTYSGGEDAKEYAEVNNQNSSKPQIVQSNYSSFTNSFLESAIGKNKTHFPSDFVVSLPDGDFQHGPKTTANLGNWFEFLNFYPFLLAFFIIFVICGIVLLGLGIFILVRLCMKGRNFCYVWKKSRLLLRIIAMILLFLLVIGLCVCLHFMFVSNAEMKKGTKRSNPENPDQGSTDNGTTHDDEKRSYCELCVRHTKHVLNENRDELLNHIENTFNDYYKYQRDEITRVWHKDTKFSSLKVIPVQLQTALDSLKIQEEINYLRRHGVMLMHFLRDIKVAALQYSSRGDEGRKILDMPCDPMKLDLYSYMNNKEVLEEHVLLPKIGNFCKEFVSRATCEKPETRKNALMTVLDKKKSVHADKVLEILRAEKNFSKAGEDYAMTVERLMNTFNNIATPKETSGPRDVAESEAELMEYMEKRYYVSLVACIVIVIIIVLCLWALIWSIIFNFRGKYFNACCFYLMAESPEVTPESNRNLRLSKLSHTRNIFGPTPGAGPFENTSVSVFQAKQTYLDESNTEATIPSIENFSLINISSTEGDFHGGPFITISTMKPIKYVSEFSITSTEPQPAELTKSREWITFLSPSLLNDAQHPSPQNTPKFSRVARSEGDESSDISLNDLIASCESQGIMTLFNSEFQTLRFPKQVDAEFTEFVTDMSNITFASHNNTDDRDHIARNLNLFLDWDPENILKKCLNFISYCPLSNIDNYLKARDYFNSEIFKEIGIDCLIAKAKLVEPMQKRCNDFALRFAQIGKALKQGKKNSVDGLNYISDTTRAAHDFLSLDIKPFMNRSAEKTIDYIQRELQNYEKMSNDIVNNKCMCKKLRDWAAWDNSTINQTVQTVPASIKSNPVCLSLGKATNDFWAYFFLALIFLLLAAPLALWLACLYRKPKEGDGKYTPRGSKRSEASADSKYSKDSGGPISSQPSALGAMSIHTDEQNVVYVTVPEEVEAVILNFDEPETSPNNRPN